MPRDGSGVYIKPFPDVVPDATIESSVYNGFVADVAQDLNTPRPIVAGGTGAINVNQALTNLGAEKASQIVTNYDSHVWLPGSFKSAIGATAAPNNTHAFSGICHLIDGNAIFLEARMHLETGAPATTVPNKKYIREKGATWGPWIEQTADLDAKKVNRSGDTMSGALIVTPKGSRFGTAAGTLATAAVPVADANVLLYQLTPTNWAGLGVDTNGNMWMRAGIGAADVVPALYIDAVANALVLLNEPTAAKHAATKAYADTKLPFTGGTISGALTITGALSVGSIASVGAITGQDFYSSRAVNVGYHFFGSNGGQYLGFDGSQFIFLGGPVYNANAPTAPQHLANKAYVDSLTNFLPLTGGTVTGVVTVNGGINTTIGYGGAAGALLVEGEGGSSSAMISFHRPGAFGANFGIDTDNLLKVGGWSLGGGVYRLWTEQLGGMPVSSVRMAFAADYSHNAASGVITEPYAGAAIVGLGWYPAFDRMNARYRYIQMFTNAWYTVSTA